MTEQELIQLGFKKKKIDSTSYWYEIRIKKHHRFLTCDTYGMRKPGIWNIGYEDTRYADDPFWFNDGLISVEDFIAIRRILTGI